MTTAPRVGQEAADYARARVGDHMPDEGLCLQFTRQNYGIDAYYYSAADAWHGAARRHPGDRRPPLAASIFFEGSGIYGHVCITVEAAGGEVVSTWGDEIRLFPSLEAAEDDFGPYLGWTEDLNTVTIWTPAPPATTKGIEMFVTRFGSTRYRLVTGDRIVGINEDSFQKLTAAGVPSVALANEEVEALERVLVAETD